MKYHFIGLLLVLSACGQPPAVAIDNPKIEQVSTFDVALNKSTQYDLESQFDSVLNPQNLNDWMKHMSSKPHHVGSPWSKQNAEFAAKLFESWGFESEIETFEVLVPFPKIRKLELVAPEKVSLQLQEPALKDVVPLNVRNSLHCPLRSSVYCGKTPRRLFLKPVTRAGSNQS